MRVIFAGTPDFAAVALQSILQAGHEVVLVLSQPDRPAGRGMKLQPSAVKQLALQHGLPVVQPQGLRLDGRYAEDARTAQQAIAAAQADVMVVVAYGLILPQWVLDAPRWGCLNIHASLLPRWRGAAPIHRAIEAGDAETGVCIMQMDAGLDTGPVVLRQSLSIGPADNTSSLHDKLAALGGELIVQTLGQEGSWVAVPQAAQGVTYAEKLSKAEAAIDWQQPAAALARKSRAFDPFPGCVMQLDLGSKTETIKVWQMEEAGTGSEAAPGTLLALEPTGLLMACGAAGRERVRLLQVQKPGGKRMAAAAFAAGNDLILGSVAT